MHTVVSSPSNATYAKGWHLSKGDGLEDVLVGSYESDDPDTDTDDGEQQPCESPAAGMEGAVGCRA